MQRRAMLLAAPLGLFLLSCNDSTTAPGVSRFPSASANLMLTSSATPACPGCAVNLQLVRAKGEPIYQTVKFAGDPNADYVIDVDDHGSRDELGFVWLNDKLIVRPRDILHPERFHLRQSVQLRDRNTLVAGIIGRPGSTLSIQIIGGVKTVDAKGGTVTAPGEPLSVTFPPGALAGATEVSVLPSTDSFPIPGWQVITGPYAIGLSQGALLAPATVRLSGPIGSLPSPEVWTLESGIWSHLATTSQGPSFIEVQAFGFSPFDVVQSPPLAQTPNGALSLTKFASDGTYGIPLDPGPGLNGYVSTSNVHLDSSTINIVGSSADCGTSIECGNLRGTGGAIVSSQTFGYGKFSALVHFQGVPGTRYAFYMYGGAGSGVNCKDEATIEIDYYQGSWHFHFTTYRLESPQPPGPVDCTKLPDPVTTHDSREKLVTDYEPRFDPALDHTLTIDREPSGILVQFDGIPVDAALANLTPLGLPTGNMHIMASAWAPSESAFQNEPKITAPAAYQIKAIQVGDLPDLQPTLVSAPSLLAPGARASVTFQVQNVGAAGVPAGWSALYYLSQDNVITSSDLQIGGSINGGTQAIPAGGTVTVTDNIDTPGNQAAGTYFVGVIVNPNGSVPESNPTNNTAVGNQVTVGNAQHPSGVILLTRPGDATVAYYRAALTTAGLSFTEVPTTSAATANLNGAVIISAFSGVPTELQGAGATAINNAVQGGSWLVISAFGYFTAGYAGIGTAGTSFWSPVVNDEVFYVTTNNSNPLFSGLPSWVPPMQPDPTANLMFQIFGYQTTATWTPPVTATIDQYESGYMTYGWPYLSPSGPDCVLWPGVCTPERSIGPDGVDQVDVGSGRVLRIRVPVGSNSTFVYGPILGAMMKNAVAWGLAGTP